MTATSQIGFDQASFDAFLDSRNDPEWLTSIRRLAWDRFAALPWPSRSDEEWIRSDIRTFKLDRFNAPGEVAGDSLDLPGLLAEGVELGGQVRSLDSQRQASMLSTKWSERGVLFGGLEEVLSEHAETIAPHFLTRAVNPQHDKFAALHAAFLAGGSLLYVPRGVTIDEPFHVQSMLSDGGSDFGHILVILEDGAEATVLCESGSPHEAAGGLHCGAVELLVGRGANLRFVNLQDWGQGVWHFAHQKAVVEQDANLQWTIAAMGAKLAKVNQEVALVGPGAHSQVNGVLFTEGKQHLAYHTLQHHEAESCRSDFLYKAALQDKSRTVWRGMIKVDSAAQRTDGYQRNDNLLLSDQARADSIPGLEIEADDVRCTHGSTSGRVDEELIFYARCRGYTRTEAIQMIVTGFFQQIFDRITIESVRNALGKAIARRVREYE